MAAQPPRPPFNNLLFCGPPPAIPHVVLLPNNAIRNIGDLDTTPDTRSQTNYADALNDINNVGLPICDERFVDQVKSNMFVRDNVECQLPPENFLRRTHSFDISDIYTPHIDSEIDYRAFRHRRSEPDLSKYGLFVEAEVAVECCPMQPPPLVLNNPFYDGSYALDSTQLNQSMIVLPENYLAFEDSFVPTWDCNPEHFVDRNTEFYYDGLPLIPSNDPWSAFCNENAAFQYYSPHFEPPIGEQGDINYMPLTDLDYEIPQYMSLPVAEQANIEDFKDINQLRDSTIPSVNVCSEQNVELNSQYEVPKSSAVGSNVINEDEKNYVVDSLTNKESSRHISEESLNADISNDVTSSLAFVPSSKSSQRPHDADDTSEDTSPCSTDYHEASALDLVQSLDELSCCDSTDYSQSRDDGSPSLPELPDSNVVVPYDIDKDHNKNSVLNDLVCSKDSNLSLNQLPFIPINDRLPAKLPLVPKNSQDGESPDNNKQIAQSSQFEKQMNVAAHQDNKLKEPNQSEQESSIQQSVKNIDSDVKDNTIAMKISQQPPRPPAVPPSWLAPKQFACNPSNTMHPPQIRVQNAEGVPTGFEKSPKPPSQPSMRGNQSTAVEPQPSCSFAPPQPPLHTSQLKPEKQPKEVEVSPRIT